MASTMNDDIDYDFSQLDDTLISEQQKQSLVDYINQLKSQKRSAHDELTQFKSSTEQRFHELAREYDTVRSEVVQQRELESQLRRENEQIQTTSSDIDRQLTAVRQSEQQLNAKLESLSEQVRQLSTEREQLRSAIDEQEKANYELQKQRESLEEENRQVHNTNTGTITRLQALETTTSQLQSMETLWSKERQLYTDQLQALEQSLIESKKLAIDQQTQIMQLTVQLESTEGQSQAQKRSLDMGLDEKNDAILNLDRQLRDKTQRIEQLQTDLQRTARQMENQQITSNKTIQSLKAQIDELVKKNATMNEQYDEQNQLLAKITSERDVIKTEMGARNELFEKQSTESEQTIRRLQDELDNTTQLLETIRSKGADLTQLTNFLDGTLSHIRSSDSSSTTATPTTPSNCPECRQLKSALVLELTGKERFRFGYEQLSSMIKEAAPILRRQKQDYEASFEVIAKLTSELNEARKELSELHHLSGESIENYRYIQRENQFLVNDNKSLATKIQVLLSEIEELRTGKRLPDREASPEHDPNQQVPLTFRNVVELQHVNQKLDKLVREMRAQSGTNDEDLNRTRFDELKKEHQQQQEKLKETRSQLDAFETQMTSLVQERDFLRLLVSRSSSSQSTSSGSPSVDTHQVENLRDQVNRLQEKIDALTKKNTQLSNDKEDLTRSSNEKVRSIQYELLTARTEVEQAQEKLHLIIDEQATNRLTIASLRTEINGWQERHNMLVQIRGKHEQQYFNVLTELRQLKDEKASLECRLTGLENERKFDAIKSEQLENECTLLKSEISKNEQIQPVIEKLQALAEFTKEKTKAMFEAKINDLTALCEELRQRLEQNEREKELMERTHQSRLDEMTQNLQQEKTNASETRTKFLTEKERAEQLQKQLNEIEIRANANTNQKTDFEQQLGNYEKELKLLRVKLDTANKELELKQTLIQSGIDNANQLNANGQKAIGDLDKIKQEYTQNSRAFENEIERLKQEILNHQGVIGQNEETIRSLNERMQAAGEQHSAELAQANERHEQAIAEKDQLVQQMQNVEQSLAENESLKEKLSQLEATIEQQQASFSELEQRYNELLQQVGSVQSDNQRLMEQIQQYETTIVQKDDLFKAQQDITQQVEQRYAELEQKHSEQHALMIKLSTHLAAKESETVAATTDSSVNESWNAILTMNNYLRVENTRLTEEVDRVRLENAHTNERNGTLEQTYVNDQQTIEDLTAKIQTLQTLQERFEADQQQITELQGKCQAHEQDKQRSQQESQAHKTTIEQLNQQKQALNNQIKQTEEKRKAHEEQLTVKTAEIERQARDITALQENITKLGNDNQELKQTNTKLKNIAIKYRSSATAAVAAANANAPATSTPAPSEADELLGVAPADAAPAPVAPAAAAPSDANRNRPALAELTEKMNKLRDALLAARTKMLAQSTRLTQLASELARAKQARISTDLTEAHAIIDGIRQTYETEINDLKHVIQLFDSTDPNEHMNEIVRLRKRLDQLTANKAPSAATITPSTTAKQSEDVTPKPTRPQAIASPMTQEPLAISRVAPMAPASGRQIGVATPMTASVTPTSTSMPLWTATPTTDAASAQAAAPVEHSTTQLSTPAGVNLLMKRTRTDDGDHKSTESTMKRPKAETETNPLIAHVEPQVREQQPTPVPEQPSTETMESNMIDTTRPDVVPIQSESEGVAVSSEEATAVDSSAETGSRPNVTQAGAASALTTGDTAASATATAETSNMTATETAADQRRGIPPIVYDVQIIPTIGGGGMGRQRPSLSISGTRRPWPPRGGGMGGGRGGLGGRGAGGVGNPGPPRQ